MSLPGTPGSWLKLAAPVVLLLLLGGYVVLSRSGALSGDVFVVTSSGAVERAAGIDVVLVRAEDFEPLRAETEMSVGQAGAAARRVLELLGHSGYQPFAVKTTTTDGTGHYVFPRVPRGRFYVIAARSVSGTGLHWAVPVDIVGGAQRLDLSDRNASRPRRQDPR